MADVDGIWNTTVKSPLGDQNATLTVRREGDRWSGSQSGSMGGVEITDGTIDGNTLRWRISVTKPMTMTLDCEATIDGDTLTGSVGAGVFGSFPMTGRRAS